jgi:hypothetical protein
MLGSLDTVRNLKHLGPHDLVILNFTIVLRTLTEKRNDQLTLLLTELG